LALAQIFRAGRGVPIDTAAAERWQAEADRQIDTASG
jgi:hypothetical protein